MASLQSMCGKIEQALKMAADMHTKAAEDGVFRKKDLGEKVRDLTWERNGAR